MKNEIPKVSVVMSVYNEPIDWLHQSIDSILNQTFTYFEFIIICDNPQYGECISLLKGYAEKDNRIILIVNEENIGLTKSLNKGLSIAKGVYIVRMDADDISMPERLMKQVEFMDENPQIVASGSGSYTLIGKKTKVKHRLVSNRDLRSMLIFDSPIYHPSAIFRRNIDGKQVQYNEYFTYSQDYALWISLMEKYVLSNIDEPLIKYRISNSQISSTRHNVQREFAIANQKNAVSLLQLPFSEREFEILRNITRTPEEECDIDEIKNFIYKFNSILDTRKDLEKQRIVKRLLLLYANYLPRKKNIVSAFFMLISMFVKLKFFNLYCVFSLINKYFV